MSVGVILTTYGEPTRNSFGEQWMYSYRILRRLTRRVAAIPGPLLPVIATARARQRVTLWRGHRFASDLEPLHEATAAALTRELNERGQGRLIVRHAYEFRRPDLADTLSELHGSGVDRFVVVPMYIADGDFTHGMTRIALGDAVRKHRGWCGERDAELCSLTASEADEGRLAAALADHCVSALIARGVRTPDRSWALLLAAHGTVLTPPAGVDNGLLHFGRVLGRVKRLLRPRFGLVRIGWLNHTRGGRWTTPAVPDALRFVRERGYEKLAYFPWGFTTDNAETALEGRVFVSEMSDPLERVEHLECMNAGAPFIRLLADRVLEHVERNQHPHGTAVASHPATLRA